MELIPIRKASGPPLVSETRGRSLTRFGQQALLTRALIVSEGMTERTAGEGPVYHGSTLVTVALDRPDLAALVALLDPAGVIAAVRHSIGLHVRLMRLARYEAERRTAPLLPRGMRVEMEFAVEAGRLLIDIGVECPLAEPVMSAADGAGDER
jgi:hypothetical protein